MKLLKKYLSWIISSFLLLFPSITAINCGYWPMSVEYNYNIFNKAMFSFGDLYKFIYYQDHYYYELDYEAKEPLTEGDQENISQWLNYTNNKSVKHYDVYAVLYKISGESYINNKDAWDINNRFISALKSNNPIAFKYICLLKKLDFEYNLNNSNNEYYWHNPYEKYQFISQNKNYNTCIDELKHLLVSTTDKFLQRRIALKLMTQTFYIENDANRQQKLDKYFNQYIKQGEKDWLYYVALHYQSQYDETILLETFMFGKDKRMRCVELLKESNFLNNIIKNSKSPEQKAAAFAINSFCNPGKNLYNLNQIIKYDDSNRDLNFLIIREINKLEDWLLSGDFYPNSFDYSFDTDYKNYLKDLAYAKSFKAFLQKCILSKTINNDSKTFLQISITYIDYLTGKYAEALTNIKKINPTNNYTISNQIKWIELILEASTTKNFNVFEDKFMHLITEMQNSKCQFSDNYYQQIIRLVSHIYCKNPQLKAKGLLLTAKTNLLTKNSLLFYSNLLGEVYADATVNDIDEIFKLIHQSEKSSFENFITQINNNANDYVALDIDTLRLLDIKGIKLMKVGKYEEAYKVYAALSDSTLNSFPFNLINDDVFIFRNHNRASEYKYNKKTFLKQFISYKNQLKINPYNPEINFYVGNALLNMTYFGNAWPMIHVYKSSYFDAKELALWTNKNYVTGEDAIKYYQIGLQNTKDLKLKALLTINIAYIKSIKDGESVDEFKTYKKICKPNELEFILNVANSCDVYNDYLKPYRKIGNLIIGKDAWLKKDYY